MLMLADSQKSHSEQWGLRKVEWFLCLFFYETMHFSFPFYLGDSQQILQRDGEWLRLSNDLHRLTAKYLESSSESFVTTDDLAQALFQCRAVQMPAHAQGHLTVICRNARVQLVQEPQSLLRIGERNAALSGDLLDRR